MVRFFVLREIVNLNPVLNSAIYCTSGTQAAARAKEGFDMVRAPPFF